MLAVSAYHGVFGMQGLYAETPGEALWWLHRKPGEAAEPQAENNVFWQSCTKLNNTPLLQMWLPAVQHDDVYFSCLKMCKLIPLSSYTRNFLVSALNTAYSH